MIEHKWHVWLITGECFEVIAADEDEAIERASSLAGEDVAHMVNEVEEDYNVR